MPHSLFMIIAKRTITILVLSFVLTAAAAAQTGKIDNVAQQASLVTEFEVNGMKVLVKRRASAPTFAAGLFVRGGV